ncbi:hypothetical protein ES703_27540 [subsurface metagenome]
MKCLETLIRSVSGAGKGQKNLSNVKYLGWQDDMEPIYKQTTVLLRVPKHDGLSLMVLEALARGRQVIWTNKFPFCYYVHSYVDVKNALLQIKEHQVLNYRGARYVIETLNEETIITRLIEIYKSLRRRT